MLADRTLPLTLTLGLHLAAAGLLLALPPQAAETGTGARERLTAFLLPAPRLQPAPAHRATQARPAPQPTPPHTSFSAPTRATAESPSLPPLIPVPVAPPLAFSGSGLPGPSYGGSPGPAAAPATAPAAPLVAASTSAAPPSAPARSGADSYGQRVHRWIEQRKSYPVHLAARRLAGTVILTFELDRRGRLCGAAAIVRSSGEPLLDRLAQQQLAAAAPFPRAPDDAGWRHRSFTVPLTYRPLA